MICVCNHSLIHSFSIPYISDTVVYSTLSNKLRFRTYLENWDMFRLILCHCGQLWSRNNYGKEATCIYHHCSIISIFIYHPVQLRLCNDVCLVIKILHCLVPTPLCQFVATKDNTTSHCCCIVPYRRSTFGCSLFEYSPHTHKDLFNSFSTQRNFKTLAQATPELQT